MEAHLRMSLQHLKKTLSPIELSPYLVTHISSLQNNGMAYVSQIMKHLKDQPGLNPSIFVSQLYLLLLMILLKK